MHMPTNSTYQRWCRDQRGTIAIIFALTLTIGVGVTGAALDYARALSAQTAMQSAADAAAISAASLTKGTDAEKITLAAATFNANYDNGSRALATPSVSVSGDTVIVTAAASVPTSLSAVLGVASIEIAGSASATPSETGGARACILALEPHGNGSAMVDGSADLAATDCSVYANSDHENAIRGEGSSTASATTFCANGSTFGESHFTPPPASGCNTIDDPFAAVATPSYGGCTATSTVLKKGSHTLTPGVYCGGILAEAQANVTFSSGTYFISGGELRLKAQSSVTGNGVVFVFVGNDAKLLIDGGADVDLKAPASGSELAGHLFFQDENANSGGTSTITGGGTLKMNGMAYFPTQTLHATGNGVINQNASMWTIVAHRFYMDGTAQMYVKGDADAAGLPDLVPTAPGPVVLN